LKFPKTIHRKEAKSAKEGFRGGILCDLGVFAVKIEKNKNVFH
jgi:hypothetical protein